MDFETCINGVAVILFQKNKTRFSTHFSSNAGDKTHVLKEKQTIFHDVQLVVRDREKHETYKTFVFQVVEDIDDVTVHVESKINK